MASLRKRPTSSLWFACYTDKFGKRRQRSTGTNDKKKAMKLAMEFEAAARANRTAKQVRAVIADLHKELTGEALPTKTISDFVAMWLANKAKETADSTLVFYKGATKKFLTFLGEGADRDIALITKLDVTNFRNSQIGTLHPKTVNHDLKCLKMLFKAARREGLLVDDPTEFVDTVRNREKDSETPKRAFTLDELKATLAACNKEWKSMMIFGLYTGQRLKDIADLTWANLDLDKELIRLTTDKTDRRMQIPIPAPLLRHIETLSAPDGRPEDCFIHPRSASLDSGTLSNQFGKILATAGLREKKAHRKSHGLGRSAKRTYNALTFHSLRATATTMMHDAGIPAAIVQEIIGHDSEEIHRAYVKVDRTMMAKGTDSLPDIVGA